MRPEILFPLFAPVTALPGVGPRIGKLIEQLAGPRVVDLCWHLPSGLVDRRFSPSLAEAPEGAIVTVTVTIDRHEKPRTPRLPYRVRCHDETGSLTLVFFNAKPDWLEKTLPLGQKRVVSGRVERYQGELQMAHPDHVVPEAEAESVRRVEPVYPLTAGLTPRLLAKAIRAAVERAPELPEWIDPDYLRRQGWAAWRDSLTAAHNPAELADIDPMTPARQRLAYDELLASQLALALVRARQRKLVGRRLKGNGEIRDRIAEALPFALTASQKTAIREIEADMAGPAPMLRLLQGDVGSGKTVVALMAMAIAVEAGAQAALLAPTEILARQHLATITPLAEAAGLRVGLLTGRDRAKAKAETLAGLADGSIPIVVGTHALVQDDVEFRDLGLAVIDEQHRFGVHQRLLLAEKGKGADVLVMTATPIPRTLMLTAYGDLDVSRLTEKPAGRQPIDTRALPLERIEDVIAAVGRGIADGARAYWICPLVEESEAVDLANAEARFADLAQRLPVRVGLVHGQQKAAERDTAMAAFARGDLDILVATTVVEVGVDVPAATIMVIEHAERFGLAQLHQLRGRIGRGTKRSTCLLLYQAPLGETAKARLRILRETDDGFRIAEEDLKLRGAGELLGTRQSGLPDFRLANIAAHAELLAAARDDARLILDRDPDLAGARGQALRVLLYLFERDAVVKTVRSG
ncbi:ATP-dependent DNA helicase RecG [Hypericibacter adhaerens]|uniref:Probable DNA 3'-5' helicase RecG n=2 Tax=Hypericibacter adhaerens TaxID=2602016 RepID=A0A5J6MWS7_9PROT|nr:ATP-dependent DNA helicase RecG [Hypericibacter adhaerens]QEX22182.1 ATP-dependent DNA helicase RecG [Hypericibacter adhaerens]